MKRVVYFLVIGLIAAGVNIMFSSDLSARPAYKARLDEMTKSAKAAEAIKEAKCNNCHYGTSKKNRNDFGKALNKYVTAENFKELTDKKDDLNKKVDAALKSALKDKSSQGKTFGELIESGSLPAVNPAE